jgi:hypothetical protein
MEKRFVGVLKRAHCWPLPTSTTLLLTFHFDNISHLHPDFQQNFLIFRFPKFVYVFLSSTSCILQLSQIKNNNGIILPRPCQKFSHSQDASFHIPAVRISAA